MPTGPKMPSTKLHYAIHFDGHYPGHPGYLFLNALSSGAYGVTMLVLSLLDNEVYVRKIHDVTPIDSTKQIQCIDAHNLVVHQSIPLLCGVQDFTLGIWPGYVVSSSLWTFCNGGTLATCRGVLMDENYDELEDPVRLPEACLWGFLLTMLKVLLDIHRLGVVHRDAHENNWFLHWPTSESALPELFLGDFGLAARYPSIADEAYNTPFKEDLDLDLDADTNSLRPEEFDALKSWHGNAVVDMIKANLALRGLVTAMQDAHCMVIPQWEKVFGKSMRKRTGLCGYSFSLVGAIEAWERITVGFASRPFQMRRHLEHLCSQVSSFMQQSTLAETPTLDPEAPWYRVRTPLQPKVPAMWEDFRGIMDFDTFGNTHDDDDSENAGLDTAYREGANLICVPYIDVQAQGMEDPIRLYQGQFGVVQLRVQEDELNDPNWKPSVVRHLSSLRDAHAMSSNNHSPDSSRLPRPANYPGGDIVQVSASGLDRSDHTRDVPSPPTNIPDDFPYHCLIDSGLPLKRPAGPAIRNPRYASDFESPVPVLKMWHYSSPDSRRPPPPAPLARLHPLHLPSIKSQPACPPHSAPALPSGPSSAPTDQLNHFIRTAADGQVGTLQTTFRNTAGRAMEVRSGLDANGNTVVFIIPPKTDDNLEPSLDLDDSTDLS